MPHKVCALALCGAANPGREAAFQPPHPSAARKFTRTTHSYRKTSAGAIFVALRAGYNVARKLTAIARPAIQKASTHCGSKGTKLIEYTASSSRTQWYLP